MARNKQTPAATPEAKGTEPMPENATAPATANKPEESAADAMARNLNAGLRAIRRAEKDAGKVDDGGTSKRRIAGFRIGVQEMTIELEKAALAE